jgi:hypothetical protein
MVQLTDRNGIIVLPTKGKTNMQEDLRYHRCERYESWWVNDYQGIPLCRVCDKCEKEKLSQYRPEILRGYDQSDVDEQIEADEAW